MTLLLSWRVVCACWFFCLHDRGPAEQNTPSVWGGGGGLCPALCPLCPPILLNHLVSLLLLILSYFVTMEAWGNTCILHICHILYYFNMLFCYEENKMKAFLYCLFFHMQSRIIMFTPQLYFILGWIFSCRHVK